MINKISQHFNKGMNRDISDSKVSNEFAFENHNIRITENHGDTLLSITNEKGNEPIQLYNYNIPNKITYSLDNVDGRQYHAFHAQYNVLSDLYFKARRNEQDVFFTMKAGNDKLAIPNTNGLNGLNRTWCSLSKEEDINVDNKYIYYISDETLDISYEEVNIVGKYCGHCVIADYLVLFTNDSGTNYIYRINKEGDRFICKTLYTGNLNITEDHPLECIGDYQTENIIKVYWTDGINQPRVINILQSYIEYSINDPFSFAIESGSDFASVTCTNNYNEIGEFPSGVIQYFVTGIGYNNNESAIISTSNLLPLKNKDRALSEDENYNYSVKVNFLLHGNKNRYTKYILYSIIHTSFNGGQIARKVGEFYDSYSELIDTGNIGESIDPISLLYKGSEVITANTIASKDNTLFLGNIGVNTDKMSNELLDMLFDNSNFILEESKTSPVEFTKTNNKYSRENVPDSTNFTSYLRTGNYYRIGIQFKDIYGKWSTAFYVGDIQITNKITFGTIIRPGGVNKKSVRYPNVKVTIKDGTAQKLLQEGFTAYRLLIVLPDASQRVVVAQGVLNNNVINIGDRNSGASYVDSSWFFRPISTGAGSNELTNGEQEFRPYYPIIFADKLGAEIQSQNKKDYNEAYDNNDRDLQQYLISPEIVDFYTPDINSLLDRESLLGEVTGVCSLVNSEDINIQWNSRAILDSPVGIDSSKAKFVKNLNKYNVSCNFIDTFYFDDENNTTKLITGEYSGKERLWRVLDNSINSGLTYAIYPWHRDSSLNNDVPREGRTANRSRKILSKYNYFETSFLSTNTPFPIKGDVYKFDNSVDLLKINDHIYRGNVNTIVSPKRYATPIYIGEYSDTNYIYWGDRNDESSTDALGGRSVQTLKYRIQSRYLRNGDFKQYPINLEYLDKYSIGDDNNNWIDDVTTAASMFTKNLTNGDDFMRDVQTTTNLIATMDPVSIKFKTSNHAVFEMNNILWFSQDNFLRDTKGSWFAGKHEKNQTWSPSIINIDSGDNTSKILWLVNLKRRDVGNSPFGDSSEYNLKNNSWCIASDEYKLLSSNNEIPSNTGDTYLYRWDVLKTFPYTQNDKNSVIEIGSFLMEAYYNVEGRYDKNKELDDYTTVSQENFGLYNDVYNQKNTFFNYRYLPKNELNTNKFPNQFIWTLEHTPGADIDNWTNLSYGSFYNVNGDNGEIRAIRRYGDSLLGFQDSGIFQIMYNSRTQISTTNGLPIELANSGKVDGVRYLTDKEGCVNKWSIKITPNGVYFIDDLNYAINLLQGSSLKRLSEELGFSQWCKDNIIPYKLWTIDNGGFRTYYDRILNDVYFTYGDKSLVYSEKLGQFMTFMDYPSNYAMDNLNDTFISFNNDFWNNRTGEYNSFFGVPRDYFVKYRIAPDPYINKTFNNIEYVVTGNNRTSNYTDLIVEGVNQIGHSDLTLRPILPSFNLQKKFNVWRANIPREDNAILNRIQSPWIYLTLKSDKDKRKTEDKIELHNLLVKYSV